ncbi:DUF1059 domain-containing protein [Candidatus Methylomirabilis sp.]|uniref:DUF1059 domain-containing protein n=1 Tax=Candidatus Methylomirabilis sp. TaxID=2032687 RepID=UPI003C7196BB
MMKSLLTAFFAVTLVFAFSTSMFAQDTPDMKAKKEEMKQMGQEKMKKMDEMGKSGLQSVSCDTVCGFRVTSHDEAELTGMVKMHAKTHHQKEMSDADVKAMMKPVRMREGMMYKMEEKKDEGSPHKH